MSRPIPTSVASGTVFGSVDVLGRGRGELLTAGQDSANFVRYLEALEQRHMVTGCEMFLVLDDGPCHTSKTSRTALAARADWLHVVWLARFSLHLNQKQPEWKRLKRDARGQLARSLRTFADGILAGLHGFGGEQPEIIDAHTNSTHVYRRELVVARRSNHGTKVGQ